MKLHSLIVVKDVRVRCPGEPLSNKQSAEAPCLCEIFC